MSGKRYPEEFKIEAVKQITEKRYPVIEVAAMQALRLQCSEETFHRGMVAPAAMLNVRFVNDMDSVIGNSHSQSGISDAV